MTSGNASDHGNRYIMHVQQNVKNPALFVCLFFTSPGYSPYSSSTLLCKTLSNLLLSERYIQ